MCIAATHCNPSQSLFCGSTLQTAREVICFNCSFEAAMSGKEHSSLAKQIRLAYAYVRRCVRPANGACSMYSVQTESDQ